MIPLMDHLFITFWQFITFWHIISFGHFITFCHYSSTFFFHLRHTWHRIIQNPACQTDTGKTVDGKCCVQNCYWAKNKTNLISAFPGTLNCFSQNVCSLKPWRLRCTMRPVYKRFQTWCIINWSKLLSYTYDIFGLQIFCFMKPLICLV